MISKLCVNWFGGPGIGKTVAAASLFTRLKKLHIDVELVAEFPKDLILENNLIALKNQIYVFGSQLHRIECTYNNTTVSIVDSPLLLSAIYNPHTSKHLIDLVFEQHKKFNNLNIFMDRNPEFPHSMHGRIHSLTESISLDNQILRLLIDHDIPHINYDDVGEDFIVDLICQEIGVEVTHD